MSDIINDEVHKSINGCNNLAVAAIFDANLCCGGLDYRYLLFSQNPPVTSIAAPLMKELLSELKNVITSAISEMTKQLSQTFRMNRSMRFLTRSVMIPQKNYPGLFLNRPLIINIMRNLTSWMAEPS